MDDASRNLPVETPPLSDAECIEKLQEIHSFYRNLNLQHSSLCSALNKELQTLHSTPPVKSELGVDHLKRANLTETQLTGILAVWSDDMRFIYHALQTETSDQFASQAAKDLIQKLRRG